AELVLLVVAAELGERERRYADDRYEAEQLLHAILPSTYTVTKVPPPYIFPRYIAVPPTVMPLISVVGMPTPTGTDCPSLPQIQRPSLSLKSLPTAVTFRSTSGPLPMRLTLRIGAVTLPPSIIYPSVTLKTKS